MFDRAVVLSLPRRVDRRRSLASRWAAAAPPFDLQVVDAVDGAAVPRPADWLASAGAWGCLQSHLAVWRRALHDGVDTLAVFEDDVTFAAGFTERLQSFVADVPGDWEALMLGGQHLLEPHEVTPATLRCELTIRTHAYVLTRSALPRLCRAVAGCRTHFDVVMGHTLGMRGLTYAPASFLCGVTGSASDCRPGRVDPIVV